MKDIWEYIKICYLYNIQQINNIAKIVFIIIAFIHALLV